MDLAVDAEALGDVRDLHAARDPHVVLRIDPQEVGRLGDQEVRLRLDAADVLRLEDRRLQRLPQLAVRVGRHAGIAEGILVPEVSGLVAGASDVERVGEGAQLACGVEHQFHGVADAGPHVQDIRGLLALVALVPAVDLEGAIAHLVARDREVAEGLLAVQAAGFAALRVIRRCVGRKPLAVAAEQLGNGHAVLAAREIPEGDVERAVAHVVELPRLALEIVVDALALLGLASDEIRREHDRRTQRGGRTDPVRDVFADESVGREDAHRVLRESRAATRAVMQCADGTTTLRNEIACIELEDVHFDALDAAHGFPRGSRRVEDSIGDAMRSPRHRG